MITKRGISVWLVLGLGAALMAAPGIWQGGVAADPAESESTVDVEGSGPRGDFNGDGYHDLAIGVPYEDVGDINDAGGVEVIYGSSNGLNGDAPVDDQFWTQGSPGMGASVEANDRFGTALAWGDFNDDGDDDLAIGVPFENVKISTGDYVDAGVVHVLYGSGGGLTTVGTKVFSQNSSGIEDQVEAHDLFGSALAAGSFGEGSPEDLAIGVPGEDLTIGAAITDAGAVNVIYGSDIGLGPDGDQFWHQGSPGIAGEPEAGDQFGAALAAADFGDSGKDDLAIGAPYEDVGAGKEDAGAVNVIYGARHGLTATGNDLWHQDSSGIGGAAEAGDRFGTALAAADFGNGSTRDLAIGSPYEDVGPGQEDAGAVNVIYGSPSGLAATGNQLWHSGTAGVPGDPDLEDFLGSALAAGNLGRETQADLAMGVPFNDLSGTSSGAVVVLYGSPSGLTADGSQYWTQDSSDAGGAIEGETEDFDYFGDSLAAANFGKSSTADLAVGVPGESYETTFGSDHAIGAVNVIYGSSAGLTAAGDQFWWQRSDTLHDSGEEDDRFGTVLA
jgi:hypothetical protein